MYWNFNIKTKTSYAEIYCVDLRCNCWITKLLETYSVAFNSLTEIKNGRKIMVKTYYVDPSGDDDIISMSIIRSWKNNASKIISIFEA